MKPYQALVGLLLVAPFAALTIGLAIEHQARLRLAAQHQALEQQLARMNALAAENQQLSNRLAQAGSPDRLPPAAFTELLRLRGEAAILRSQKQGLEGNRKENDQIHVALSNYLATTTEGNAHPATNYWPQDSWINAGYGTPEATLQTMLWALNNGDVSNFMTSIAPDRLKELSDDLTKKSASEISADMANELYDLKSVRLLSEESPDANTMLLQLECMKMDAPDTVTMVMERIGGQWLFGGPKQ
jgi:type II secretory pathway component PulJ